MKSKYFGTHEGGYSRYPKIPIHIDRKCAFFKWLIFAWDFDYISILVFTKAFWLNKFEDVPITQMLILLY